MTKYTLLTLLLSTSYITGMEIVPFDQTKEQSKYHKKCDRIARYFIKQAPNMQLSEVFNTFEKLNLPVKLLIHEHALKKESSPLMLVTVPKDIFVYITQLMVPQYETKQKVKLEKSAYSEYRNGYAEYRPVVVGLAAPQQSTDNEPELLSTHHAQQKILNLKTADALSALSGYANQKTITIQDMVEDRSFGKDSLGTVHLGYYDEDDNLQRSYGLSLDDFLNTTAEQRSKLNEIATAHSAGLNKLDKRYKMTQEDIDLLMPIKDIIDGNDLFKYMQIGIACEPATKLEQVKDVLLLTIPLAVTEGVVPYMIHSNISGKAQGFLGAIASYGSGFFIGNWIFPMFDAWNTNALLIHKNFGPDNKTTVEKRWSFAILGLFHFITHAIAEKFLSIPTASYQAAGYAVHGLRVLSSMANIIDIRHYIGWRHRGILAEIGCGFHLKKYDHPLKRRNKDDKSYTLIDLLNAQAAKSTGK